MAFKIITYKGWKRFWEIAFSWFSSQFAAIQNALTDLDVDVDLSGVAKQDTLLEQSNPYNSPNLFFVGIYWYAATDILQGDYQIFKRIGVPHENDAPEYLGFRWRVKVGIYNTYFYYPAVGQTVYDASATEVYIDRPYPSIISQVKTVRLSKVLDLIGTPASGQPATLFEAIAEGGGGELEIMTDDEYEPALEDLDKMLDEVGTEDNDNA